jgi:hypothetical protein
MTDTTLGWMQCELMEQVTGKVSGRPIVRGTRILPDAIVDSYDLRERYVQRLETLDGKQRKMHTNNGTEWPATSAITAILHRSGLLHASKRKKKVTPSSSPPAVIAAPNQVWCMDFKGYFRCGNRQRCDPFTITDG